MRKSLSEELSTYITDLPGLTSPLVRNDCSHVYYGWVLDYDERQVGVKRDLFVEALNAEGFPCYGGYVKPLYLLPVFQNRKAYYYCRKILGRIYHWNTIINYC